MLKPEPDGTNAYEACFASHQNNNLAHHFKRIMAGEIDNIPISPMKFSKNIIRIQTLLSQVRPHTLQKTWHKPWMIDSIQLSSAGL